MPQIHTQTSSRHSSTGNYRLARLVAIVCLLSSAGFTVRCCAQQTSTWIGTTSTADWFNTANWSGAPPNQSGDVAQLMRAAPGTVAVTAADPLSLGGLELSGRSAFTLATPGGLSFDNGSAPSFIDVTDSGASLVLQFNHSATVPPMAPLAIETSERGVVRFQGGIAAGSGSLNLAGAGKVALTAPSPGWTGAVAVAGGELSLEHTLAMRGASAEVLTGGRLNIVSPDATPEPSGSIYAIGQVTLRGGALQTNLGADRHLTQLATDLVLSEASIIQVAENDVLVLRGGIRGDGGVRFLQREDPGVAIARPNTAVQITGATSYRGETYIGPYIHVAFTDAAALGDTTSGTRVDRGTLSLEKGGGAEQIEVIGGRLRLAPAPTPYGHAVTLRGGVLDGGDATAAELTNRVLYADGAELGYPSTATKLVLAGGIEGAGSLVVHQGINVSGGVAIQGNLYASASGEARMDGSLDIAGDLLISSGRLRVGTSAEAVDAPVRMTANSAVSTAILAADGDLTLGSVLVDYRRGSPGAGAQNTGLAAAPGAVITIGEEFHYFGGAIQGALAGPSRLIKRDRADAYLVDIAGGDVAEIYLEGGALTVTGDSGDDAPLLVQSTHDTARIWLRDAGDYTGEIRLADSSRYRQEAALTIAGNTLFNGVVHLGSQGSSIGAAEAGGGIGPGARLTGGSLIAAGQTPLLIQGGDHSYTGATHVLANELILIDGGRLHSTSAIVGYGLANIGGRSRLILDNSGAQSLDDRIADHIPIELGGMSLSLIGHPTVPVTETLGTVAIGQGVGRIALGAADATAGAPTLKISALQRTAGGAVRFDKQSAGSIVLAQPPSLDDGLIGGWAQFGGDDFASYGPDGVVPYRSRHSYQRDLASATPSQNVDLGAETVSLATDARINALRAVNSQIELNGHTLTIESGGLLSPHLLAATIAGGRLTAGSTPDAELFAHGNLRIDANIVDNEYGPVGLTFSALADDNSSFLRLSGNNSYSGPTVVNSAGHVAVLEVTQAAALPAGGDVILNGGHLHFDYVPTAPLKLGRLELREAGRLRSSANNFAVEPDFVQLESGSVEVGLTGNAPIVKIGPEEVHLHSALALHQGPIHVQQGSLWVNTLGDAPLDEHHAITIDQGGALRTDSNVALADRPLRLNGGVVDFVGLLSAPIDIVSQEAVVRGRGRMTSPVRGAGRLIVEAGLGSSVLNLAPDLSGFTGELLITGGNVNIENPLTGFNGPVHLAAAQLAARGVNPLGLGVLTVDVGSTVALSSPLTANLALQGGGVQFGFAANQQSPTLGGSLVVASRSYVSLNPNANGVQLNPAIASDVTLLDGAHLAVLQSPSQLEEPGDPLFQQRLRFTSQVGIAGDAAMSSYDGPVTFAGQIVAAAPKSTLDLQGPDSFYVSGTIVIPAGTSLELLRNGATLPLELSGPGVALTGGGVYQGDVSIASGARVAPGASPGTLSIEGDAALGGGAVLEWEINDAALGTGLGWDLFHVAGDLAFTATPLNPWQLKIADARGIVGAPTRSWLIAQADSLTSFNAAAVNIVVADPSSHLKPQQFALSATGDALYLHLVPEPASWLVAAAIAPLLAGRLTSRRRCRPPPETA